MKMLKALCFVAAAVAVAFVVGCNDWTMSTDDWSSTGIPVNYFSGVYTGPNGEAIVQNYNTNAIVGSAATEEYVATGDGTREAFYATLTRRPIQEGSLIVEDGTVTFYEIGPGILGATGGASVKSGTIDYNTGDLSLDYNTEPPLAGVVLKASYRYITNHGSDGSALKPIYSFTVFQTGNSLQFRDNHGTLYDGSISSVAILDNTTYGLTTNAYSAIAQYSVEGDFHGISVQIVGTLESEADFFASLLYRRMYGTWIENGGAGQVGNVVAQAAPITYWW